MVDMLTPEAGNDIIHIERNGNRTGPFRCMFSHPRLTLFYGELDLTEGDKLLRSIPGREEIYTVELVNYYQSFDSDIPACYMIEISKDTAIRKPSLSTTTNHISIHSSTGIQIGDHNVQNLEVALKEVLASIDKADAPREEREEAKNRLNAFLAHPLVSAAVGGALPVTLGLLS